MLGTLAVMLAFAGGCAREAGLGQWHGPRASEPLITTPWRYEGSAGQAIRTTHYRILTTIDDDEVKVDIARLMEGALGEYSRVAEGVILSDRPMDCYVFGQRAQWNQFTRSHTGADSAIYLQILRGGYTVRDWYVAYYIGDVATYSVAAHEGWHQFVARHFVGRLPPFLEEGMACLFEKVEWQGGLPRWNLSLNPQRAQALRSAMVEKRLWPLRRLIRMHAGEVVGMSGDRIEAFYAQAWAFAKFLWEADQAKYRPALRRWLTDTAAGRVFDPTGSHRSARSSWNRNAVEPMLEHYLEMDMASIEKAYAAYLRRIAFEEFRLHWATLGG